MRECDVKDGREDPGRTENYTTSQAPQVSAGGTVPSGSGAEPALTVPYHISDRLSTGNIAGLLFKSGALYFMQIKGKEHGDGKIEG